MSIAVKDLETSLIEELRTQIRGELIFPENSNYNETRKVYNGMINKHPGMFVMCVDVADVVVVVGVVVVVRVGLS